MEIIREADLITLSNSGVESRQLLLPENTSFKRLTITRVTMPPSAVNPRRSHEVSEQVWIALESEGELLRANDRTFRFGAGDMARFSGGDIHGFRHSGTAPFSCISVTSPPVSFRGAYERRWGGPDN